MTDDPTIALVFPTCNNLPILRSTLIHNMRWADQICILDLGSSDGTQQFLEAVLRPQDQYERFVVNTIPHDGYSHARNYVAGKAGTDWIFHGGSNCCLDWKCAGILKSALDHAKKDTIALQMLHVDAQDDCIEVAVQKSGLRSEWHRRIHRRGAGIQMVGYMHEELHRNGQNCYHDCEPRSDLKEYHFEGRGDNHLRQARNAWMLLNAVKNPELQFGVNAWWFEQYVPANLEDLQRMADDYERNGVGR